jgi:hypothetical protein
MYSPNMSRESKLSIAQLSKKKNFLYPFFLYNMGGIKPKKTSQATVNLKVYKRQQRLKQE